MEQVWLLEEPCRLMLLRVEDAVDVNTTVAAAPSPGCTARRWHLSDGYLFDERTETVQFADPGVGQDEAVTAMREGSIPFAVEWHFKWRRLLPEFRPMAVLCPGIRVYPRPTAYPRWGRTFGRS